MKNLFLLLTIATFFACSEAPTRFERLGSDRTGIDFANTITETDSFHILNNEYLYNGGGVGVADLNDDGLSDLVFTGNQVSTRIYLNRGNFKFKNITANFAGLTNDQWYSGVAIADVNGDGRPDIYLTSTMDKNPQGRKNKLWIQQGLRDDGEPYFEEQSASYGVDDDGYGVHAGFLDYDLDGDLDLYVLNNIVGRDVPTNYRDKMVDGTSPNNDRFYRNNGQGKFENVTRETGIRFEGFGLGLAIGDVNKDGYPDIYVSNDYISNDLLYINQKDGTFENYSEDYLSYQSKFSMGNDMADVNNDGYPDIMTLDMLPEQYFRKKQTINGNSYYFYVNDDKYGYQHQYVRNMLHLHNGFHNGKMLPYSEVGQMMGIFETEWSWSPLFADYDNDGDRDLLITNGFPKDLTDKDFTNYKAQVHGFVASDEHVLKQIPVVKVSNYAYENTGNYQFEDRTEAWGMKIPSFSNGAAFVDLDNDGDLDYVVNNINDEAFVYRNNTIGKGKTGPGYLRVKLQGQKPNTMAIGAKVELWSNGAYQFHEHFLTRGYISSVEPVAHFGLAENAGVDSVRITWPQGRKVTVLTDIKANQLLTVDEAEAPANGRPSGPASVAGLLFEEQPGMAPYVHQEEDYIDFFQNQRIIPHKFSQIGPCMAKGDLDNDGVEDLIIGASNREPTTVFLRRQDRFEKADFAGLTDQKQCSESDLVVTDVDGDGDNDVVALSGGYVNNAESDYQHFWYRNDGGVFAKVPLPLPPFPASIVRPFDVDRDGDLDLFAGARVQRGDYPFAGPSYLLINEGGRFAPSPAQGFNLGMVTDAAWSDFDGDGWTDLLIAREWNSPAILRNENGKTFQLVNDEQLSARRGVWSAIAAGDLDQDGDDDYILGNLGENHRFNISEERPMRLYAVDIDGNGVIDPLTTAFWPDKEGTMREYPVNYLDELAAQSPFFRKRFTSYTQFSYMTIDSILDKTTQPDSSLFSVNTTSSYILWKEESGWRWERLPVALQTAPIKEMLIRDFNGDNLPDVLIAGNDHTYDVSTGYYDANKGMLLLGKGDRTFDILPPAKSGLLLQGQVESLLYFEGDTSLLVAGINRRPVSVFRHARGRAQ